METSPNDGKFELKTGTSTTESFAPGKLSLGFGLDIYTRDEAKKIGSSVLPLLQETESDFDNCAVCIEGYKPNDVVRILPCR